MKNASKESSSLYSKIGLSDKHITWFLKYRSKYKFNHKWRSLIFLGALITSNVGFYFFDDPTIALIAIFFIFFTELPRMLNNPEDKLVETIDAMMNRNPSILNELNKKNSE